MQQRQASRGCSGASCQAVAMLPDVERGVKDTLLRSGDKYSPTVDYSLQSARSNPGKMQPAKDERSSTTPISHSRVLQIHNIPRQLIKMEYAVRGVIVSRAEELKRDLLKHPKGFTKFQEIIPANIGNPQLLGQKPITFNRQVLACLLNPSLLQNGATSSKGGPDASVEACIDPNDDKTLSSGFNFPYPDDVKARARYYLEAFPSFGAYSHSKGVQVFREDIACWFKRRDGYHCDPESIFLTDGASSAIRMAIEMLITCPSDGIMIPVPQYPLYTATITRLKGTAVPYFLEEEKGWHLSRLELHRSWTEATKNGINVKAIVIINPGNPTGSLLRADEIQEIIRFCETQRLVILADEVYQSNVYCEDAQFVSFRQTLKQQRSNVELVSFHSSSKGLGGECGVRGGLFQLENIAPEISAIFYKVACVTLCANTIGQAMLACLLTPPLPGQPSYKLYAAETQGIFESLKRKSIYATQKFNEMEGICCQPIDGAMYAFPKLSLPQRAMNAAKCQGIEPDMLYCKEMLEECGVVCVPGSGFVQRPGTYHFRVTILLPEKQFTDMLESIHKFHNNFLKKYRD